MVYRSLLRPLLFNLPPETAHHLALKSLSLARPFIGRSLAPDKSTAIKLFGLAFPNPIGLAAGFDKNGVALQELASLGFGHIEAGTVTFHAQPGNPKPRLFRLPQDQALINRAGFNNEGAEKLAERLMLAHPQLPYGINLGKSKIVPLAKAAEDYAASYRLLHKYGAYFVV